MAFNTHLTSAAARLAAALSLACLSCESERLSGDTGTQTGRDLPACARNDAIAKRLGCAPAGEECEPPPAECEQLAQAWFDCVERDLRQCICESDDEQLNCEGSFKADEGPARCVAEYRTFEDCVGEE